MDHEAEIIKNSQTLHSDMQTLVYENYNKFISATDTIRKVSRYWNKIWNFSVTFNVIEDEDRLQRDGREYGSAGEEHGQHYFLFGADFFDVTWNETANCQAVLCAQFIKKVAISFQTAW